MDNKKGQLNIATIFIAFIGIIVGVVLFTSVAQTVGTSTNTVAIVNSSFASNAANNTSVTYTGYIAFKDVIIFNETEDVEVPSTNYTVANHVLSNGAEVVTITPWGTVGTTYKGKWKVSATAEPQGYIGGASRSMALLIPIFFALLIALIALEPTMRDGMKELMGR